MSRLMERLRALNQNTGQPNRLGVSMVVRYTPEPASGESLAVGVVIRSQDGRQTARWVQKYARIHCAFGDAITVHLPLLLREAAEQVAAGKPVNVPMFTCTDPVPVYGDNMEAVIGDLFSRFVPLAREPDEHDRKAAPLSVQNDKLRTRVFKALRQRDSVLAENIIAANPELSFPDASVRTILHVPLQGMNRCSGRFGTIVSAQAGMPNKLALNIYPAVAELAAAAKLYKIRARGVFILRPREDTMPPERYDVVDSYLNDLVRILENQGNDVFPEIDETLLTVAIQDWSTAPVRTLSTVSRSARSLH